MIMDERDYPEVGEPQDETQAADASAVATQEATDEDSNGLRNAQSEDPAVAIRKQAEPANGYRTQDFPAEAESEDTAEQVDAEADEASGETD